MVEVAEEVLKTPVCQYRLSGWEDPVSSVDSLRDIVRPRRSTERCTTNFTSLPRVTSSRTRTFLLSLSTRSRLKSSVRRNSKTSKLPEEQRTLPVRRRELLARMLRWESRMLPHQPQLQLLLQSLLPLLSQQRVARPRNELLTSPDLVGQNTSHGGSGWKRNLGCLAEC